MKCFVHGGLSQASSPRASSARTDAREVARSKLAARVAPAAAAVLLPCFALAEIAAASLLERFAARAVRRAASALPRAKLNAFSRGSPVRKFPVLGGSKANPIDRRILG